MAGFVVVEGEIAVPLSASSAPSPPAPSALPALGGPPWGLVSTLGEIYYFNVFAI